MRTDNADNTPAAAAKKSSNAAAAESKTEKKTPEKKSRDPLLAAICHDLRAPLAAVTMGANFVLSTTPEDEASGRSRRVLQAMLRSCKQMERVIRDFGDLSEIESEAITLRPGVHDLGELIEMIADAARQSAATQNQGVTINVVKPSNGPVLVRCDRERIVRAVDHLIDNAIRFAPKNGDVAITISERNSSQGGQDKNEVVVQVRDQGPGLSAETLEHLYDRTWHAKRAERVGAGLGLALARGLILAHGGSLSVESTPGSTTFSIVLPKDQPSGNSGHDVTIFQ